MDKEAIAVLIIAVVVIFILLFLRNFYNWLMKRNYRSKYKRVLKEYENVINEVDFLKSQNKNLVDEKNMLISQIKELNQEHNKIKNFYKEKEYELRERREREKKAYEKKLEDFKYERIFYQDSLRKIEVKASNTRLSAHFLKNVLFKIQESYKKQNKNKIHLFGNLFFVQKDNNNELLPIDVLEKIYKLLDYNVSTIKELKVPLNKEVGNVILFLDVIKFLKPKVLIHHNFKKNYKFEIFPTLFFPFLENALKHSNFNRENSYLKIELIILKNTLLYKVVNSYEQIEEKEFIKGFGLESLEKALKTYYKTSELEFSQGKNEFISELTVELE